MRELATLPKAHLHLHLAGAMRPTTLMELGEKAGIVVPEIGEFKSFEHFMVTIQAVQQVLRTLDDVERHVSEVVEDAAVAGAIWVEPSIWLGIFPEKLGSHEEIVRSIIDAGQRTAKALGIGFGLMVSANRARGPEEAVQYARLATSRAGNGVVSFGLDGEEVDGSPVLFQEAFAIAANAGLLSTPHAGELGGPKSVIGALDDLKAHRILHGVRAIEDEALVERLAASNICLDVCPTSNVLLGVASSIEDHPLRPLLQAGVRCSINADDPLLFNTSLLEEYELCRSALQLSDDELAACARTSLEFSGAPRPLISQGVAAIDEWLKHDPMLKQST
jgi:adenosine deaminase